MKMANFASIGVVLTLALMGAASVSAAETGTVSAGTINVRGRPGFLGEVVTKLNKGDMVTILDSVTLSKPQAGEPTNWFKIALPANTPVWVHTSFVDPATQTIKPKRLNVRGGPSVNHSVLGSLSQGTVVKEIRRQGEWMEIEPTPELFAFVAANMITQVEVAAAANLPQETPTTATTVPAAKPAAATTEKPAVPPGADIGAPTPPPATPVATTPTTTPPAIANATIVAEPAPGIVTPPATSNRELSPLERAQQALEVRTRESQRWEVTASPDDQLLKELPANRRLVTREGKVQRAISIQAPSPFILEHIESGLRLNYLYTSATNIPLKELLGVKVRIKGEEGIDQRWPGTPVLLIKELAVLP